MGLIRTLLALCVVVSHMSPGWRFFDAQFAVQGFYLISGFLISLILTEQGAYQSVRNFYLARYLRLIPIYLVVAGVSLICFAWIDLDQFWSVYDDTNSLFGRVWLVVTNVLVFGQAQLLFMAQLGGEVVYPLTYTASEVKLWHGMIVPPAWTLELELMFYLIAPFILHRRGWLLALLAGSVLVRVLLWHIDLAHIDPWTYRFFPAELALFILGALAHQLLLPWYLKRFEGQKMDALALFSVVVVVGLVALYGWLDSTLGWVSVVVLLMAFVLLLPGMFVFQQQHRWDKLIGDLSYPIYIGHWLIVTSAGHVYGKESYTDPFFQGVVIFAVVVFAFGLDRGVARPVERYRRQFRAKAA